MDIIASGATLCKVNLTHSEFFKYVNNIIEVCISLLQYKLGIPSSFNLFSLVKQCTCDRKNIG